MPSKPAWLHLMAYGRYCGTNAATIIHTVPYTGRGKIKYICRMATPSTMPGNTRGTMVKRSSIQRREMLVRATIHATTNATATAPEAEVILTSKLLAVDLTIFGSLKARA